MICIIVKQSDTKIKKLLGLYCQRLLPNVYICSVSARIRSLIWQEILQDALVHEAYLIYTTNDEQGYTVLEKSSFSKCTDFDGITLISKKHK